MINIIVGRFTWRRVRYLFEEDLNGSSISKAATKTVVMMLMMREKGKSGLKVSR